MKAIAIAMALLCAYGLLAVSFVAFMILFPIFLVFHAGLTRANVRLKKAIKAASASAFAELQEDPLAGIVLRRSICLDLRDRYQLVQHDTVRLAMDAYMVSYTRTRQFLPWVAGTGAILFFDGLLFASLLQGTASKPTPPPAPHSWPANLWAYGLMAVAVNAFNFSMQMLQFNRRWPELAGKYNRFFVVQFLATAAPWVVMGMGTSVHHQTTDQFLKAGYGDPFLIAFLAILVIDIVGSAVWVFFLGGAEFLVRKPGLLPNPAKSMRWNKAQFVVSYIALVFIYFWLRAWPG